MARAFAEKSGLRLVEGQDLNHHALMVFERGAALVAAELAQFE